LSTPIRRSVLYRMICRTCSASQGGGVTTASLSHLNENYEMHAYTKSVLPWNAGYKWATCMRVKSTLREEQRREGLQVKSVACMKSCFQARDERMKTTNIKYATDPNLKLRAREPSLSYLLPMTRTSSLFFLPYSTHYLFQMHSM